MVTKKCPSCDVLIAPPMYCNSTEFDSFGTKLNSSLYAKVDYRTAFYRIIHYHCPNCNKNLIEFEGVDGDFKGVQYRIFPQLSPPKLPDYIPLAIRQDFYEAYNIKDLSPKSSATLARRCLQGMIRDYFNVKENNLKRAIDAIQDSVSPVVLQTLNDVRQIGNIGAHMEQDINLIIDISSEEASILLDLIQYLIKAWYIERHDAEKLFQEVSNINELKQHHRKSH